MKCMLCLLISPDKAAQMLLCLTFITSQATAPHQRFSVSDSDQASTCNHDIDISLNSLYMLQDHISGSHLVGDLYLPPDQFPANLPLD